MTAVLSVSGQLFIINRVYEDDKDSSMVYSIEIRNTANDSIMVLHSQESALPPFINAYKTDINDQNHIMVHFGKSNNPLIPEKYRATFSLTPKQVLNLYFRMERSTLKLSKELELWYSMMDEKFAVDFKRLETSNSQSDMKRCRKLKEKYGKVRHKFISFN